MEIAAAVNYIQELKKHFQAYKPRAQYLTNLGFHRLEKEIQKVIKDLSGAENIWIDMYFDAINQQQIRDDYLRSIQQGATDIIQQADRRRQEAFEYWYKVWHANFVNQPLVPRYCPYCGNYLGTYNYYYFCPKCSHHLG